MSAPEELPNGTDRIYEAFYEPKQFAEGVVVQDGQFVAEPTQLAMLQAVCFTHQIDRELAKTKEKIPHHVFIERMEWDQDNEAIRLITGQ